jgi:hypothetical protein
MTFETEMNQFFASNRYSEQERKTVKEWPAYRNAVENDDAIKDRRNRGVRNGKQVTFETEMNQFFTRNCYSEKERETVKAWPVYQCVLKNDDIIKAQEIATQVQEGKERNGSVPGIWQNLISLFIIEHGKRPVGLHPIDEARLIA